MEIMCNVTSFEEKREGRLLQIQINLQQVVQLTGRWLKEANTWSWQTRSWEPTDPVLIANRRKASPNFKPACLGGVGG